MARHTALLNLYELSNIKDEIGIAYDRNFFGCMLLSSAVLVLFRRDIFPQYH